MKDPATPLGKLGYDEYARAIARNVPAGWPQRAWDKLSVVEHEAWDAAALVICLHCPAPLEREDALEKARIEREASLVP